MILKDALVLIDDKLRKVDIRIIDGIIKDINVSIAPSSGEEVLDLSGKVILPGFVNTHTHVAMSLFRGFAEDLSFNKWLFEKIQPSEEKLTSDAVYYSSLMSMIEMVSYGTVAFCDMYFYEDAVAQAVADFGMKALLTRGLVDNNGDDNGRLEENLKLYKKWHGYDNRIYIGLGPHAPYSCSKEYLLKIVEIAKTNDMAVTMHFFENAWEYDKYSPEEIIGIGFDKIHFIPVHCTQLRKENLDVVVGTYPSINTVSNMKLGNGVAPISDMIEKDIRITIGTDGPASNNSQNVLFDLRVSILSQKMLNPEQFNVITAFNSITVNGYEALRVKGGKIAVDYPADLVILDQEHPQLQPLDNFLNNLIHSYTDRVYATMINGKFVYINGHYPTIDYKEVLEKFTIFSRKVIGIEN